MANDSQLRAGEIKDVLLSEIEHYEEELHAEETGEVLEVKDGIARIYGLTRAMASEMLEITSSETGDRDRKSTRLNSSHSQISYAVFCLKKKKKKKVIAIKCKPTHYH